MPHREQANEMAQWISWWITPISIVHTRRKRKRNQEGHAPERRQTSAIPDYPTALIAWITRHKMSTLHILRESRKRNKWGHARNVLLITHSKKRYEEEWRTRSRVRKLSRNDNNKSYCKLSSDQNALCVSCVLSCESLVSWDSCVMYTAGEYL